VGGYCVRAAYLLSERVLAEFGLGVRSVACHAVCSAWQHMVHGAVICVLCVVIASSDSI